jgi:hypothetical protein
MKMVWTCRNDRKYFTIRCLLTQYGITFALDRLVLKSSARRMKYPIEAFMWTTIAEMKTDILLAHAEFCQLNPHLMHPEAK